MGKMPNKLPTYDISKSPLYVKSPTILLLLLHNHYYIKFPLNIAKL